MTDPRPTILPTGSTALERAVDQSAPRWDTLAAAAHPLDGRHPEPFKPWLAAEWALAEFARYFDSTDELIAAGLPWLMERGTAAAVQRALGWVGFGGARPDEDGPWLHIDLGRAATNADLARIAHVVRASVPAHVLFYRVYWAWDLRPIWLDARPVLDAGILDNESGTNIELEGQDPIKASFGQRHASSASRPSLQPLHLRIRACLRQTNMRLDVPRLDAWRLDSDITPDAITAAITHRPIVVPALPRRTPQARRVPTWRTLAPDRAAAPATALLHSTLRNSVPPPIQPPRGWQGRWDHGRWAATNFLTRVTTETA